MLRAMLRQLSTAAAVRTVPTPCRARGPGVVREQAVLGEARTPPPRTFVGEALTPPPLRLARRRHEAIPAWGDGAADAGSEVWDLNDGFLLPPPLLELSTSEFEGEIDFMDWDLTTPERVSTPVALGPGYSPCSPEGETLGANIESYDNEMLQQLLIDRLGAARVLLPFTAAVLAGGRRFPQARSGYGLGPSGPRGQALKAGNSSVSRMRLRQQRRNTASRQGSGSARNGRQSGPRGR